MAKYKYVYALVDPRNPLQPFFYIGKGSGDRKVQHFRNIPKGMQGDPTSEKYKTIEAIKKAGLTPSVCILSHHTTDDEAYAAEQVMIEKIGQANLTNKSKGGEGITTKSAGKNSTAKVNLSAKEEKFCQLMVTGKLDSASAAYRTAYPGGKASKKTVNEMAARIMKKPKIAARIEELRAPVVKKVQYDLEWCIKRQNDAVDLEETGNAGAMSGATREIGKLVDAYPAERSKIEVDGDALVVRIQQGRMRSE